MEVHRGSTAEHIELDAGKPALLLGFAISGAPLSGRREGCWFVFLREPREIVFVAGRGWGGCTIERRAGGLHARLTLPAWIASSSA